jgi:uncharacterized membrane protein YphA (DoxX/SURF4 family)
MNDLLIWTFGLCRILVGVLLLAAGIAKVRNGRQQFTRAILGYDLVPRKVAQRLSQTLPWIEIVVGSLLALGLFTGVGLSGAFVLVLAFTSAIVVSLWRGRKHHCGCVGFTWAQVQEVQWNLVYRNLVLLAVLVGCSAWPAGKLTLDHWLFGSSGKTVPLHTVVLGLTWCAASAAVAIAHWHRNYRFRTPTPAATSRPRV